MGYLKVRKEGGISSDPTHSAPPLGARTKPALFTPYVVGVACGA
jgi:hypothetical protein